MPGGDQSKYNETVMICLQDSMAFCVVWQRHYGDCWLFVWLRNVLYAIAAGAAVVVITGAPGIDGKKILGNLGFAQRSEVSLLLALRVKIHFIDIDDFLQNRRPLIHLAKQCKWAELVVEARAKPHFVNSTCVFGKAPLHYAVEKDAPVGVIAALCEVGANPLQQTAWGRSVLHLVSETAHRWEVGGSMGGQAGLYRGVEQLRCLVDIVRKREKGVKELETLLAMRDDGEYTVSVVGLSMSKNMSGVGFV